MSTHASRGTWLALLSALLLAPACGSSAVDAERDSDAPIGGSDAGPQQDEPDPRCTAPAGVSNAPVSVAQAIELMNALPKPLTLPCFVQSLARPLRLRAVNSQFSAQPAEGARSPRIFLFNVPLIMSVVPAGAAADLLEFGEMRSPTTSLKAELAFPITEQLDAEAPYRRLAFNDTITVCGACHQGEQRAPDVGFPLASISQALRPVPNQYVPLAKLSAERDACDWAEEPARCALLDALLTGTPTESDFPAAFNTFF